MVFNAHTEPHYNFTPGQLTFFFIWLVCLVKWLWRKYNGIDNGNNSDEENESDKSKPATANGTLPVTLEIGNDVTDTARVEETAGNFSANIPPPTLDEFLKKVVIFGVIMFYFYLCDYRKIFSTVERVHSLDTFLCFAFVLFLVACCFTLKPTNDVILNRNQTEEWKGWMQVMFVWYHVFAAKEWYNWVRVYIAAYVWMTGYGNFSFFWVRKDYSLWRFLRMLFRLNFLVTCLCVITSNEYMLYYICAMHSYWFISVYVFMGTLTSWNTQPKKMALKFFVYFLFNAIIFEIPAVRDNIFKPLWLLLRYSDPRYEPMHEWPFRATLDHWACFAGMLCAYICPHVDAYIKTVETRMSTKDRLIPKVAMFVTAAVAIIIWYTVYMGKEKYSYNAAHPYTSIIPIICYIVVRNSLPVLRRYYVGLYAWLGKITLETYLCQYHVYLQSNAKHLIGYIPGYPLLNIVLSTFIYLPIAYVLFNLTKDFGAYLIPKDMKTVSYNVMHIAVYFLVTYTVITILQMGSAKGMAMV